MTTDKAQQLSPLVENLMYAASMCMTQGKADDAILLYDKVIDLMPNYANAYYERGHARHQTGNPQGAAEDLKYAFQLSPELEKEITGQFHAGTQKCK